MNYLKSNPQQVIKQRFKELRALIKEKHGTVNGFNSFVVKHEKCYDNPAGWDSIKNFWYFKYADIRLLELAKDYLTFLNK